jgi:MFS family permease
MNASIHSSASRLVLPMGGDPSVLPLLAGRALRALVDGYMAVLLPAYLLAIGLGTLEVGIIATVTMLGSALFTIAVGAWGHRFRSRRLLRAAALLMALTGLGFAAFSSFWPLLLVAFVGTLNPSSGDVSVFLPLEHARLASAASGRARTSLFARYSLLGAVRSHWRPCRSGSRLAVGPRGFSARRATRNVSSLCGRRVARRVALSPAIERYWGPCR